MDLKRHETIARILNRLPPRVEPVKKFACSICKKEFNTLVDVRHHRRKEHNESRSNKNTIGGSVRAD
jgi:hypothetical protein